MSDVWINTVCYVEVPSAHADKFTTHLLHELMPVKPGDRGGPAISIDNDNGGLTKLKVVVERLRDDSEAILWGVIVNIAETLALDGLDMVFGSFATEYAWSRE